MKELTLARLGTLPLAFLHISKILRTRTSRPLVVSCGRSPVTAQVRPVAFRSSEWTNFRRLRTVPGRAPPMCLEFKAYMRLNSPFQLGASVRQVAEIAEGIGDEVGGRDEATLAEVCAGKVPDFLLQRAEDVGFRMATRVQRQALPVLLEGKDCILQAQTGSGKTLCFLLPVLASINAKRKAVQAVIVVPTRELGMQVARVARLLVGRGGPEPLDEKIEPAGTKEKRAGKILVMTLLDGAGGHRQRVWLKADPPQVVVGTPDRLHHMMESKNMQTHSIRYLVIDEVDSYPPAARTSGSLHRILTSHTSISSRQTILASATIPQHNRFVNDCVKNKWTKKDVVHINLQSEELVPPYLEHRLLVSTPEEKINQLFNLIKQDQPKAAIVFGHERSAKNKQRGELASVEAVAEALAEADPTLKPMLLQEDDSVQTRASIIEEFRDGSSKLLVATDLAARGLDLPEVSHIYNYDLPATATSYVHRAGRTGRQPITEEKGTVTSIVTEKEIFALQRIANALRISIEEYKIQDAPG